MPDLHSLLTSDKYDLVFVVESWLDNTITDAMLTYCLNFTVVRRDRGSRGGGVTIFIRNNIVFYAHPLPTNVEGLCLDFGPNMLRVLLGYLPDGRDEAQIVQMCNFLSTSVCSNKPNLVLGDFNMASIDWETFTVPDLKQNIFFTCISELGLQQLVNEPTLGTNISWICYWSIVTVLFLM